MTTDRTGRALDRTRLAHIELKVLELAQGTSSRAVKRFAEKVQSDLEGVWSETNQRDSE